MHISQGGCKIFPRIIIAQKFSARQVRLPEAINIYELKVNATQNTSQDKAKSSPFKKLFPVKVCPEENQGQYYIKKAFLKLQKGIFP
jgi:hypothetical protein